MQLRLSPRELKRLGDQVAEDYMLASRQHDRRIERFRSYYQRWRNRVDPPRAGEENEPNFSVPLTQWNVLHKWADEVGKLLGDDAEIVARGVGPSDQKSERKLGLYWTWRVFQSMRLVNPFAVFAFRKLLFGRAHAYSPYIRDTFPVKDPATGRVTERLAYEGPGFVPLWPDDLIVPAEDADTIHDFSFVIRRYRARPDDLLRGEAQGLYQGITDRWEDIVKQSKLQPERSPDEPIKDEKDEAEGVDFGPTELGRGSLEVHEWYGWWRRLRGRRDASVTNLSERQQFESELVVPYLPDMNLVIGVQDLLDVYPTKRHRRPLVEASLVKDGSYWSPGLGELLESIEDETTVNHRLFTKTGMFAAGPVIFFKPSSGFDPETFEYAPATCVPTEDPAGVNAVRVTGDLQPFVVNAQTLGSYAERVTGNTDFSMGRSGERPNAPRTARGTLALLDQGNVRANLDVTVFREDMGAIVKHFCELEQQFPGSEATFFRVTEQQAKGLFPVTEGGAFLQPQELGGEFDFNLKFATSVWSREARKEQALALYQIGLQNPLIAQNPRALWMVTRQVYEALGEGNFGDIVPEPADLDRPHTPEEEWTAALQGEDPIIHPDDHDELHDRNHMAAIQRERAKQLEADTDAIRRMIPHIKEHREQRSQKLLRQVLVQQVVASAAQNPAMMQQLLMGGGGAAPEQPAPAAAGELPAMPA